MVADVVVPMSDKVNALKCAMLQLPQWQPSDDDCRHYFGGGIYARWLARPAGTTIVGKVHKKAHLYFVVSGTIAVTTDEGVRQITGPEIISCKPGTQRAVVAITDAICVVFVRVETDSQDLADVEDEIVEPMPESPYLPGNRLPFDIPSFRQLTSQVIAAEKVGFWSDWSVEQQEMYQRGDWRAFSESRGYSTEEIAAYSLWRDKILQAKNLGLNPFSYIVDLTTAAALANIKLDVHGEISKSSHAPFEDRS